MNRFIPSGRLQSSKAAPVLAAPETPEIAPSSPVLTFLKATFAVLAWGASFIATKVALRDLPPGGVIWIRFGIGALVLAAYTARRGESVRVPPRMLGVFAFMGFLGIAFHQWLQVNGLVTAQASTSAWTMTTIPVFIALLSRLFLKEILGFLRIIGILIAALGVFLVVSGGHPAELLRGQAGSWGDLLVLASAINWSVFSVISRRILRKQSPTVAMLYVITTGWLFSAFLLPPPAVMQASLLQMHAGGWWSLAFLGLICSGVAYVFWYDALKVLPAARVGAFLYLEPLIAVMLAAVVLGEQMHLAALGGGILILAGVWMVNRPSSN